MENCFGKALERYIQSEELNRNLFERSSANDSFCPKALVRERLLSADSVEKVGHGFHGRKVRA